MAATRTLSTLALVTLAIAACQPAPPSGPIALTPGTTEYQLRQQQLQNARSGANPGVQNPVATGVTVEGIQRQGTGTGSTAAGAPVAVNPGTTGITRAPGIGPPMR
jgi:hypothetical protein